MPKFLRRTFRTPADNFIKKSFFPQSKIPLRFYKPSATEFECFILAAIFWKRRHQLHGRQTFLKEKPFFVFSIKTK